MKVEKQVRETILKHNLIDKGDHIVLGLSGGPDSMCLFDILVGVADEMNLTVHPVHVNHKFRPGAAEDDQTFVERICAEAAEKNPGTVKPCRSFVVDCNALAAELGMTSEEAGRKARYDAFFQVAEEAARLLDGDANTVALGTKRIKIAVAQNANDQAETILFRLLRGTGTDGLAGIAYERSESRDVRTIDESQSGEHCRKNVYRVVRPLLDVWREDIETYCEAKKLNPVVDHTNKEELYSRNKIRLDLIPYLEEKYNENIQAGLIRLGQIAAADKDYFWKETGKAFDSLKAGATLEPSDKKESSAPGIKVNTIVSGRERREVILDREGLAACHEAIRHRVVQRAFEEIGLASDITAERLEAADRIIMKKQGEKIVEFPHGYRIRVAKGRVHFEQT